MDMPPGRQMPCTPPPHPLSPSPPPMTNRRAADYQIRDYEPFLVAQTAMGSSSVGSEGAVSFINPAGL